MKIVSNNLRENNITNKIEKEPQHCHINELEK
jgi:hypothetical protein